MKRLVTILFLFLVAFSAAPAFAEDTFQAPNITNGTIDAGQGFVPCSGTTCSPCDLVVLFNTLLKWFMGIAFLIFAILAVKAGVTMVVSGSSGSLEAAKKSFTNAFIGLIIILAAWLIVDTLMRGLLGGNGDIKGYGPWSDVKCATQAGVDEQADFFDVSEWAAGGGDSNVDAAGAPVTGGSNCPVPPASSMVTIPSQYTGGRGIKIRSDVLAKIEKMYAAAKTDGITLTIISGWRSNETQVSLYNKYNGKSPVAKPCTVPGGKGSNHNSGVAVDIAIGCGKTDTSCSSPAYRWMKAHGGSYGFNNALPNDTVHWSPTGH